MRGREKGNKDPELKKWVRGGGEAVFQGLFFASLLFETFHNAPFYLLPL